MFGFTLFELNCDSSGKFWDYCVSMTCCLIDLVSAVKTVKLMAVHHVCLTAYLQIVKR